MPCSALLSGQHTHPQRGTASHKPLQHKVAHFQRPTRRQNRAAVRVHAAANGLELFSPSKINLFLRVVRRREDGYHDLASLFHVIDLGDVMEFERISGSKDILTCTDPSIPMDGANLVIKALKLFRQKTGSKQHYRVHLEKKVPHGAGLGGGSGNAATTLWAANQLSGSPASTEDLLEWSGLIGSDISVFFSLGAAYCTGRGEIVDPVEPPLPLDTPLLLVKPPVGLSTPAIFKALDLNRQSTVDPLQLLQQLQTHGASRGVCVNDLEQPAFDKLPELGQLRDQLEKEGGDAFKAVFMTGSGSTIVGLGSDKAPAFLQQRSDLFVSPAGLIVRSPDQWYAPAGKAQQAALAAA